MSASIGGHNKPKKRDKPQEREKGGQAPPKRRGTSQAEKDHKKEDKPQKPKSLSTPSFPLYRPLAPKLSLAYSTLVEWAQAFWGHHGSEGKINFQKFFTN